jgi:type I restriction-modification system DNA methylase subunit
MKADPHSGVPFQPALLPATHRNQHLFSDHYLNSLLPEREEWRALAAEAAPVMQQLQAILAAYVPSENEAQTEEGLVKPVLYALGHPFEVQASLETPDGAKRPDYVFYRDQAALAANKGKKLNESLLLGRALAVGDAKYWNRPLDVSLKRAGGDPFDNKNPSYQIFFYMQHSGLEWGILTNGRLWRLYHKDTAHKLDRFYEVDLPALLQAGDVTHFLYFYAFFRPQAFEDGPLNLKEMLAASADYAQEVGDSLKEQVYEALLLLAQGFLDYRSNQLQPEPETLKAIYDHALIALYRLLFILYAESRDLLPISENESYRRNYSLKSIKEAIKKDLDSHNFLRPTSVTLWPKLTTLFTIINEGDDGLQVATFNGGLFDPARHPFLVRYSVGDARLQQAIDRLARVDGQFVDYRDLAERHLGTIYEGLLEFHLEPLEPPEDGWTVKLVNAKGERKATGSYYTPDYIVKYMVEETVGPALRSAIEGQASDAEKIAAILSVKVLDPAMGSGHFPVEATEYIARFLVEQIEQAPADAGGEADLAYWKRRVAQACIYGIDLNLLAVDLAKLSLWLATVAKGRPLSFLDHHLRCGNSLIGAWLADLRQGIPGKQQKSGKKAPQQTFLEGETLEQASLFDEEALRQAMTIAVQSMWLIESSPARTVAEVKEQEQTYLTLHAALTEKYSALANLVTATSFGVTIDQAFWQPLAAYALSRDRLALPQFKTWLDEAASAQERLRFFHWELEFPEVFFDRLGQHKGAAAGFDVVIGNPPYVRQEGLGDLKPYFAAAYPETYHGVADLYVYFYQQALRLTRVGGRMSFIVTNKWMRAGYGEPLRAFFAAQGALEQIIDFGHAPIFEDADVFPCILILERPGPTPLVAPPFVPADSASEPVRVLNFPREQLGKVNLGRYIREHSQSIPQSRFGRAAWNLESSVVDDLLAKIRRVGVPLAQFAGVKSYRGVLTGFNEAFLIDTQTRNALVRADPRSAEIIKPYLRGQDIKRWSPEWAGLWMIFARRGIDIDAYPAIKEHLLPYRQQLEPRPKDWNGGEWPGRKPGLYKWYEIQDSVDYWHLFEQPKLLYQEIQFHSGYCFDTNRFFANNKVFLLPKADKYLLAVLNSPLMWWYNWRYLPHMKDEALSPAGVLMETLPIAPPSEAIRAEAEPAVARLIAIAQARDEARRVLFDWLRAEFGVEAPGAQLEDVGRLDEETFLAEVRKRLPRTASHLSPAKLKHLRDGYHEQATPVQQLQGEALTLERRLDAAVNAAYGLTPEEVALLWETAPPRMPLAPRGAGE